MRCWKMRCWAIWRCWRWKHIAVEWIEISEEYIWFDYDWETIQLIARVLPHNASNQKITWSSSNPEAISVDENWLVTAIHHNQWATITATSEEWGYTANCYVIEHK